MAVRDNSGNPVTWRQPLHILDRPPPSGGIRLGYGQEPLQFGELTLPGGAGSYPVITVIHGGFWRSRYDLAHIRHACAALATSGYATWNLEYRRLGDVGGGWPGTFRDVARGVDFVRELASTYHLDRERVITLGHSAGGQLALWVAARDLVRHPELHSPDPLRLRGAISLAGVVDLRRAWELRLSQGVVRDLLGGTPEEVPERYAATDPAQLLPLSVPRTLIHGTADENVPYEISRDYARAAARYDDPVDLVALHGTGHFEVIDPWSDEWSSVVAAVANRIGE